MSKTKRNPIDDEPDGCDHTEADQEVLKDEDLPRTNLVPGLDVMTKPRKKVVRKKEKQQYSNL